MGRRKIRLSQCMIVRDEEKNIERALSWGKGIVWEQIVVDTGSVDRTCELARKMGARVYEFPWIDDFSAAKNHAIEKASGEWIAFLDADEYFPAEEAEKLPGILEQAHREEIDFIRVSMAHLNDQGKVLATAPQDRLFRNDPGLRYYGRIHEQLRKAGKGELHHFDLQDRLTAVHTGYGAEERKGKEKGERNIRLLRKQLEETPKSAEFRMYLGDACAMSGRRGEAMECYREILENPELEIANEVIPLRAGIELLALLNQEDPREEEQRSAEEAEKSFGAVCRKLRNLNRNHPDIDYMEGKRYLRTGEKAKAAELFEAALEKWNHYEGIDTVRLASGLDFVCGCIAQTALESGNLQKAVEFATAALRVNRYAPESLTVLLCAFLMEWQEGQSAEAYWQFLCKLYDPGNLKDLLFLHRFAGETEFTALEECVWQAIPEEARAVLETK